MLNIIKAKFAHPAAALFSFEWQDNIYSNEDSSYWDHWGPDEFDFEVGASSQG